ncbi:ATP-binding protein [Bacteroidota bacterium]
MEENDKVRKHWEDIFQAIGHPTVIIDPHHGLIAANKATQLAAGKTEKELIGKRCHEIFHHSGKVAENCPMESLIAGESGKRVETEMDAFDGTYLVSCTGVYNEEGVVEQIIHIATDITEKKAQGKALQDSEEKFKALSDATFEALFFSEKGLCVECNQSASVMFGYTYKELIGIFGTDVIADESKEFVRQNMMAGYEIPYEALAQRKDGSTFWAEFHGKMYEYKGRQVRVTAVRDISFRKNVEDELKQHREHLEEIVEKRTAELGIKNKQLEESQQALTHLVEDVNESRAELQQVVQKMKAANDELEAFSYSVSHDLKAPLRAIDGFSHILLEDYHASLDEKGKRYLKIVRDNTQHMGVLIQDLLEFSRVGRLKLTPEKVCLRDMVSAIIDELLKQESPRSISVDLQKIPDLFIDKTLIQQVFTNLLSNAVKFSRKTTSAKISIGCKETEDMLSFFVKDNGVGFDMKYSQKLFNVFQRLHTLDEYEGTGVGLAIVLRVIKRMGGTVNALSSPGKGTTISFTLPKNVVLLTSLTSPDEDH